MIIQYCSDLHLEFKENKEFLQKNPLTPGADILLLAGEIVPFNFMHKHNDFFDYISGNFGVTYWIPGNHEYYNSDLAKKQDTFNEKIRNNVFLVNNTRLTIDGVKFIFSTLWSQISPKNQWNIQNRLTDFRAIYFENELLHPDQYNIIHQHSVSFIMSIRILKHKNQ